MSSIIENRKSLRNRFGRFRVTKQMVESVIDGKDMEMRAAWNALMHDFIIIKVDWSFATNEYEYAGCHPGFDEYMPEFVAPLYDAVIRRQEEGGIVTMICEFKKA